MLRRAHCLFSPLLRPAVEQLSPAGGLAVVGAVQLHELDDEQAAALRTEFVSSGAGVLLARRQRLKTESCIRRAARAVSAGVQQQSVQLYVSHGRRGTPEATLPRGSDLWHQDKSYRPTVGRMGALYAIRVPESEGDTEFANLKSAWEAHDEGTREAARRVHAWYYKLHNGGLSHSVVHEDPTTGDMTSQVLEEPPQRHAVVNRHPVTSQEVPLLSPCYLQAPDLAPGTAHDDALSLLRRMTSHALQPCFTFRHRWRPGDMLFWDNHIVMHRANTIDMSPDSERVMYRMEFGD